jgi:hypothetical protein
VRTGLCALTFELTGPMRRDGLARAGKMYRVPQTGPRRPAVVGPVVQRGVRRRRSVVLNTAHTESGSLIAQIPANGRPSDVEQSFERSMVH